MQRIFDAFDAAGKELYLVGGAVRDLARGVTMEELDDLDFCTNALPEESLAILQGAGFTTYDVGLHFGTAGAAIDGPAEGGYPKDCQVTTYRSAEYYRRGSRKPEVTYGDTIDQDLGRRDFSINSIAMTRDGEYYDPYGGLDDLKNGVLRVVGDPMETLAEDPLRILRVGRFMSKLGFDPVDSLKQAATERASWIMEISRERWFMEMSKLLVGPHPGKGLRFLEEVGVLAHILPEVEALVGFHESSPAHHKDLWAHTIGVIEQTEPERAQRWAGLLHDVGKVETRAIVDGAPTFRGHEEVSARQTREIAERFKFDNDLRGEVVAIARDHGRPAAYQSDWTDAAVRRLVRDLDPHTMSTLRFARADCTSSSEERRAMARARIDELIGRIEALEQAEALRPKLPTGLGNVLIDAFSLRRGPIVGQVMRELTERIIDGVLESGREADYYVEQLRQDPPEALRGE